MAKPLPIPQYAGRIMTQAGQRPQRPGAGTMPRAVGDVAEKVGGEVQAWQAGQDKRTMAKGKSEDAMAVQNARINEMIRKRQLAVNIQNARERWKQKDLEFKELEESRKVTQEARAKEKSERDKLTFERKEKHLQSIRDFNKDLLEERKTAADENRKYSKTEAENLAETYGISGTVEADRIIDRWWPTIRPSAAREGRQYKEELAARYIPYMQTELQKLLDDLGEITKKSYEASRIIQDPYNMEREIMALPQEMRQQADVLRLKKEIRDKIEEINRAKSKSGAAHPGSGGVDVTGILKQIDDLERSIEEKETALGQ